MSNIRHRHAATVVGSKAFLLIGAVIVVLGAALRFINLSTWPGVEWDENVYRVVGEHVAQAGDITAKTEYLAAAEPYLYHPPFHFVVLGGWFEIFGSSLLAARALAVVASLVMMVVLSYFLRWMIGNWALLAVGLITVDVWMIFSNRVSWIENIMIPVGIIGLWLYRRGSEKHSSRLFIAAGIVLGLAVAYKHIGLIFPLAVGICWLLMRRLHNLHVKLFAAFAATSGLYVAAMALIFGKVYFEQSGIQFFRSTGSRESRGALNLSNVITPLVDQYAVFVATMVLALAAVVLLLVRTARIIQQRSLVSLQQHTLLYAWAMAALLFFLVLQLRFPHYFMLMLIPLFCYLVAEIKWFSEKRRANGSNPAEMRRVIAICAVLALALNVNAFIQRFVTQTSDDALTATANWMSANAPADAKVITEESVGSTIGQPYCKIWKGDGCVGAEYVIVYTSHTQKIPDNPGLRRLIASAGSPVFTTRGYKEMITVYKLPSPVSG